MNKFRWLHCVGFIVLIELIGNIGSIATFSQITGWYAALTKPSFNPPSWIFGPVWTILFALMGIALYLVWLNGVKKAATRTAIIAFSFQLILNVLWSFIFFGWHQPGFALIEIFLLWLAIVVTIRVFHNVSRLAAWLMVPYLAWVTFATLLNFSIWRLN
jgi:tryptophan-rich sensory protein